MSPTIITANIGRTIFIKDYDWSKVAVILNCEHTSQSQLFLMNQDLEIGNAINARRWYVSGSPEFQQLVKNTFKDFNVSVYTTPEKQAGGSLGAFTKFAPAFHIIDHIIYHTTLDTPELVPAVGLAYSERAFLSILDHANQMSMAALRGSAPLPNPLGRTAQWHILRHAGPGRRRIRSIRRLPALSAAHQSGRYPAKKAACL